MPELSQKENELVDSCITEPMLLKIESISKGDGFSELLPDAWHGTLTPVPGLASETAKRRYVYNIFATKKGGFLSTDTIISQHPYLLWRVPENLYQRSLASFTPNEQVLLALDGALENRELWAGQGTEVMDAIWSTLEGQNIDNLVVYNTLRLVGAGHHDVASQSSSRMFMLLGRDEWRYRLDFVKKLMKQS
jgi:glutamyl-tRNA synthetase